jgi:serine/threonine protein kinase
MQECKRHEIFVSYSHHDREWCQRLFDDYINTTFGDCRIWTDAQIRAGDQWNEEIEQRLASSTVAVMLVSDNFLASQFITEREFPTILQRAEASDLRIVWFPVGITREALLARRPELAAIQGGSGFDDPLPASPMGCPSRTLEHVRQHIRQQLLAAVDPVGAELARLLDHRYELDQWLGEGNLAAVYKARDRVLERDVVIKVIKDKDQRQRFMADVRDAIRTSEEPNFINIYDAARESETAYCVVQHIHGKNLGQRIREHPRGLPVDTLRKVFSRVTTAISRAHALGVTYGNLKPSNIILDDGDEPFILPVGRRRDPAQDAQRLHDLVERVTACAASHVPPAEPDLEDLAYLVPDDFGEQIEPVDPRLTDQYMLGLLAYEMATGERPQLVAEPARLLQDARAAFGELPPVSDRRRLCPQRVCAMVARMTARRPARRYPDLQAVLDELRQLDDLSLVIARDSYRRCTARPDFDEAFFGRFYAEFLRLCPKAQPMFQHFDSADWGRQHRMLKEAVMILFAYRQQGDGELEPNVLSRVADAHRGVPAWFYDDFLDALVATVCGDGAADLSPFDPECADPTHRDLIEDHWRAALEPGIAYMRGRATLPPSAGV